MAFPLLAVALVVLPDPGFCLGMLSSEPLEGIAQWLDRVYRQCGLEYLALSYGTSTAPVNARKLGRCL